MLFFLWYRDIGVEATRNVQQRLLQILQLPCHTTSNHVVHTMLQLLHCSMQRMMQQYVTREEVKVGNAQLIQIHVRDANLDFIMVMLVVNVVLAYMVHSRIGLVLEAVHFVSQENTQ